LERKLSPRPQQATPPKRKETARDRERPVMERKSSSRPHLETDSISSARRLLEDSISSRSFESGKASFRSSYADGQSSSRRIIREFSFRGNVLNWVSQFKRGPGASKKGHLPVFVKDKTFTWLPGKMIHHDGCKATVRITLPSDWNTTTVGGDDVEDGEVRTIKLSDYPGEEPPFQNVDKDYQLVGKADMADLPFLHEAAILYNVKERHCRGVPYTRVGDIIVATNPFQWIDGLYSMDNQRFYARRHFWREQEAENLKTDPLAPLRDVAVESYYEKHHYDPHIYEMSSLAYAGLCNKNKSQSILVTGESGAGKTETIKIVVSHLARIHTLIEDDDRSSRSVVGNDTEAIVKRVLESSLLFEAFGNAKTVRNNNSSRFGKFTQLQFERSSPSRCILSGAKRDTFLLEKNRVVHHDSGERSYHIFYQLLNAPDDFRESVWEGFSQLDGNSFKYLTTGHNTDEECNNFISGSAWQRVVDDLALFGIADDNLIDLTRTLCTVLQLGNLEFTRDSSSDECIIPTQSEFHKLTELLGLTSDYLTLALTRRQIKTSRDTLHSLLTPDAAKDSADALGKELYARLFDYLVRVINKATDNTMTSTATEDPQGVINLLDIFGFEKFAVNRFEQLCINYANEKLQNKYAVDIFYDTQAEYEKEGIDIFDFSKVDNTPVLDLIEGSTGLIALLNDECIRPKGNDSSYVYKVKMVHKTSTAFVKERINHPFEFSVHHFAGNVKYTAKKFIEKNTDVLPLDLVQAMSNSTNTIIAGEFKTMANAMTELRKSRRRSSSGGSTVISKFKIQLKILMDNISNAKTRYIRCIKPNEIGKPLVLNHTMTMNQLVSAGLVTAIIISRESFPDSLGYRDCVLRFRCLAASNFKEGRDERNTAELLLKRLLRGRDQVIGGEVIRPFACGKTKIFFRTGMLELIESERQRLYRQSATAMQKSARRFVCKRRYRAIIRANKILQAWWRGASIRRLFLRKIAAILTLQCFIRCTFARLEFLRRKRYRAVTLIQSGWRMKLSRSYFRQCIEAIKTIQRIVKKRSKRSSIKYSLEEVMKQARMDNKLKKLRANLNNLSCKGMNPEQIEATNGSKELLTYLRYECYKLRSNVSDLRTDVTKSHAKVSSLRARADNAGAALVSNKLRTAYLNRTNEKSAKKVNKIQKENAELKKLVKELQKNLLTQKHESDEIIKTMKNDHEMRVDDIQKQISKKEKEHAEDVVQLEERLSLMQQEHDAELEMLQEQLNTSEYAHGRDLTKLFDALDFTQNLSIEDDKKEDDIDDNSEMEMMMAHDEMAELKREIETLKKLHAADIMELQKRLSKRCRVCGATNTAQ